MSAIVEIHVTNAPTKEIEIQLTVNGVSKPQKPFKDGALIRDQIEVIKAQVAKLLELEF